MIFNAHNLMMLKIIIIALKKIDRLVSNGITVTLTMRLALLSKTLDIP